MSNAEPVNVMGVVAFPDLDKEKQLIRFIDRSYNELFTIPNGGNIILTHFDGECVLLSCTYIDNYHAKIGSGVYHICEFAEMADRNGAIYQPEQPNETDICDSYEIYQIKDMRSTDYSFRPYEDAKSLLKFEDYQRAYAGVLAPNITMDELFVKHNCNNRPFGREMRSMSVSDVLVLYRGGKKKAYYVDSFRFQEVPKFLQCKDRKKQRGEER